MKTTTTILMLLFVFSIQLKAKNLTRDMNKEHMYESQIEAIDPFLVETFKAATVALDQNNYILSDSLYSLVCKKAPTFDVGFRRLGFVRLNAGKIPEATELCKNAVALNRSAYNLLALAECYMNSGSDLNNSNPNLSKALELLKEGQTLPDGNDVDFPALIAQIALQENNMYDFRSTTEVLISKYPDEMVTHYFAAILAAYDKAWSKAKKEIMKANKMGLPDDAVQKFLDSGVRSKVSVRQYGYYFLWIVVAWIAGLFLLLLVGKLLSNFTIRSFEKQYRPHETSKMEEVLRSIYRMLINVGGVYYYIPSYYPGVGYRIGGSFILCFPVYWQHSNKTDANYCHRSYSYYLRNGSLSFSKSQILGSGSRT